MNLPEEVARDVFRRLDQDGDGYITTHDLLECIRESYFNDDPQSAGSWSLGPLDP
jgi:Ca2+-binding EF-hand superfamily protein